MKTTMFSPTAEFPRPIPCMIVSVAILGTCPERVQATPPTLAFSVGSRISFFQQHQNNHHFLSLSLCLIIQEFPSPLPLLWA